LGSRLVSLYLNPSTFAKIEPAANDMEYGFNIELSERELICIGTIVELWGSLESEIFGQTLMCFGHLTDSQLPKPLNNLQFSQVLELWEIHVVNNAVGKRKEVLKEQLNGIRNHQDFRDALVRGMWDWSRSEPEKITATRVRKKEVIITHFTADSLASFASALETMNLKIRFPEGFEEYAKAIGEQGTYLSRRASALLQGKPLNEK
jgi:hypothetical protein